MIHVLQGAEYYESWGVIMSHHDHKVIIAHVIIEIAMYSKPVEHHRKSEYHCRMLSHIILPHILEVW